MTALVFIDAQALMHCSQIHPPLIHSLLLITPVLLPFFNFNIPDIH